MKKKVCLIASSGGHYEQILMLENLSEYFDLYYVTEKTPYNGDESNTYFLTQLNRQEKNLVIKLIVVSFQSIKIFLKEKPDIIISTGALSVIPTFLIGKIFNKKLVFIESFAKTNSPTLTGKLLYKIADTFLIQWKDMNKIYPNAVFMGSIY